MTSMTATRRTVLGTMAAGLTVISRGCRGPRDLAEGERLAIRHMGALDAEQQAADMARAARERGADMARWDGLQSARSREAVEAERAFADWIRARSGKTPPPPDATPRDLARWLPPRVNLGTAGEWCLAPVREAPSELQLVRLA